jgi:type I restriction enzyme S subunit
VRIDNFCTIGSGTTPSRQKYTEYFNGSIPWVKSGELKENVITQTDELITEQALRETSLKLVPRGALLVAMYGATVGRVGMLGIDATTNQAVCHIVPDPQKADTRYLFHALQNCIGGFLHLAVGGAQPNISQQVVRRTEIYLPPLPEQRRIAAILDQADALRAKRREALAKLDEMAQAIFVEMFGDPGSNPKKLRKEKLASLIKLKSGEFLPAVAMAEGGEYPVLGGNGINGHHNAYLFEERQIVIGRVGAYCGCVHISPPKSWVTDNALYVDSHAKDLTFDYLTHALIFANLNSVASKFGQPLISGSRIYPVEILVPPMALQQEFAQRISVVESTIKKENESSSAISSLFYSLQYRAFRGEL